MACKGYNFIYNLILAKKCLKRFECKSYKSYVAFALNYIGSIIKYKSYNQSLK